MHILIVPSSYPTINNPISGIFFKEQGEALAKHSNIQVGCIALNRLPLHILFDKKQTLFHYSHQKVNNINTISLIYVFVLGTWHRLTRFNSYPLSFLWQSRTMGCKEIRYSLYCYRTLHRV